MRTIPIDERPRERCLANGARCLSLRELLSVLLGSGPAGVGALGVARTLLERPGPGLDSEEEEEALFIALEGAGKAHLQGIAGLGDAGQARILAAFELGRRYALRRDLARDAKRGPKTTRDPFALPERAIDQVPRAWRSEPLEWIGFVPVYRGGRLGRFCSVDRGTRTRVHVDPVELFARLLALRPAGFYLFHNHPSGDARPSKDDEELTRRVDQLSRSLGIRLLGHGVLSAHDERWVVI